MGQLALFLLCLGVVWLVGVGVGLRIAWMLWQKSEVRDQRSEVSVWERPANVIAVSSSELRQAATRRSA